MSDAAAETELHAPNVVVGPDVAHSAVDLLRLHYLPASAVFLS
jgi:hypothetical protein